MKLFATSDGRIVMKFIGFEKFTNNGKAFCSYSAAYVEGKNHEKLPYRKKKYYYQWWAKSGSSAGAKLASLRYQYNTLQSL